ncbi:MAG: aminoacyl-tRNA hydrolase [Alphaproteobacteria bacterium]
MLLIVGLGNPGREYAGHRHNVGAMAINAIHRRHHFPPWKKRFQAETAEGLLGGHKTLLLKPTTFMNESGRAVGEAARFYKIDPTNVVVMHDELDLARAKIRIKSGGGGAGHNGLRSVSAHIGNNYRRIRIGIGHPGRRDLVTRHVLRDFAKSDREWLDPMLNAIADNAELLADGRDELMATRLALAAAPDHSAISAKGADKKKPIVAKTKEQKSESKSEPNSTSNADPDPEPNRGPFSGLRRWFGSS